MADRAGRKRQIERMGYAGYTELVEGNTVRRAPLESDLREEDVSSRLIRNRERTLYYFPAAADSVHTAPEEGGKPSASAQGPADGE